MKNKKDPRAVKFGEIMTEIADISLRIGSWIYKKTFNQKGGGKHGQGKSKKN